MYNNKKEWVPHPNATKRKVSFKNTVQVRKISDSKIRAVLNDVDDEMGRNEAAGSSNYVVVS